VRMGREVVYLISINYQLLGSIELLKLHNVILYSVNFPVGVDIPSSCDDVEIKGQHYVFTSFN
jgi:hypothetical protein